MYIHELSPVAGSTHVDKRKGSSMIRMSIIRRILMVL